VENQQPLPDAVVYVVKRVFLFDDLPTVLYDLALQRLATRLDQHYERYLQIQLTAQLCQRVTLIILEPSHSGK